MDLTNKKKYTDFSYLKTISKGNAAFEQKMLGAFVEQSAVDVQRLKNALSVKDWDTIYLIAHKMKPSMQFVGLTAIQDDILSLEVSSKQKMHMDKVAELISTISTIIALAIEEVKEELAVLNNDAHQ